MIFTKEYEETLQSMVPKLLEQIDEDDDGQYFIKIRDFRQDMSNRHIEFLKVKLDYLCKKIKPILLKNGIYVEVIDRRILCMRRANQEDVEIKNRQNSFYKKPLKKREYIDRDTKCDSIREVVSELKKDPESLFNSNVVKKVRNLDEKIEIS